MSEWMFPHGRLTATNVVLLLQDKTELVSLDIVPVTRTADSTSR
jgi:hypothetical protein